MNLSRSNVQQYRIVGLIILLMAMVPCLASGQTRFARQVEECKNNAKGRLAVLKELESKAEEYGEFAMKDVPTLRTYFETAAKKWEEAAASFAADKDQESWKLFDEANRSGSGEYRFRERMDRRGMQAQQAPTEQWAQEIRKDNKPETYAAFDQWIEARKAASEAWGRAAEATTPTAKDDDIIAALNDAQAAIVEADIAHMRFDWTRDLWEIEKERSLSNDPKLTETLTRIKAQQEEYAKLFREREALERKVRMLGRQRDQLTQQARHQRYQSQRAREEAERKKK